MPSTAKLNATGDDGPKSRNIERSSALLKTARVLQLTAMFDVPPTDRIGNSWQIDIPALDKNDWSIGLIVGPSGCGKTTIARELFGDAMINGFDWLETAAVVDNFPTALGIKDIAGYLGAVGFSSPPSWLKPYHALSTGEQFRATMARALAGDQNLFVIDEFTSVVDRQVAQIACHSVQKAIRRTTRQFVAASCHYDIIDWLQPDWIYEPAINRFQRRSLQRHPTLRLDIYPIEREAWRLFKQHHYMSADLHAAAQCFGGYMGDRLVAFNSYIHFPHPRNKHIKMGHRRVVLPDYQGLSLGGRFDDWLGAYLYERGFEYHNVIAHPALMAYYAKSPRWELQRTARGVRSGKTALHSMSQHNGAVSIRRITSTFVYKPENTARETA